MMLVVHMYYCTTYHYTVVVLALFPCNCIYNTIIATKIAVVNYYSTCCSCCVPKQMPSNELNLKQTLQYFKPIDIRTHLPCACR